MTLRDDQYAPIRPDLLASKLERIANFEYEDVRSQIADEPRFSEMLWFIQWVSMPKNYAGGLKRFCEDLIQFAGERIGTKEMRKYGSIPTYTLEQAIEVFNALPEKARDELLKSDLFEGTTVFGTRGDDAWFASWTMGLTPKQLQKALQRANWKFLNEFCIRESSRGLVDYLKRLCHNPPVGFLPRSEGSAANYHSPPWYFAEVAESVLAFMDDRKAKLKNTIAETALTNLVNKWMDKARRMNRTVRISGNSRFGKTEAAKLWVQMNPGLARFVKTPSEAAESDLLREVARALGIEVGPKQKGYTFREEINYILHHSKLMLVFDEAQFLFPRKVTGNTTAARLDWVRLNIMDVGLPTVLVCTPQSYKAAKTKFVEATGYSIEQFEERILMTVNLPTELSQEEALGVARIHFPGITDERYLQMIVLKVLATERNYISDLEKIATLAHDFAQEDKGSKIKVRHIDAAISNVLSASIGESSDKPIEKNEQCGKSATKSSANRAAEQEALALVV